MGRLDSVSWRVDYTLSSSDLREVNEPLIQLKLQTQGAEPSSSETTVVSVSADKFRVLLAGQFILSPSCEFTLIFSPSFPLQNPVQLSEYCCGNYFGCFFFFFNRAQTSPDYDECTTLKTGKLIFDDELDNNYADKLPKVPILLHLVQYELCVWIWSYQMLGERLSLVECTGIKKYFSTTVLRIGGNVSRLKLVTELNHTTIFSFFLLL